MDGQRDRNPQSDVIDDCLSIRDGELYVEGCSAAGSGRAFGTPLYVVSEDQLRRNARRLRECLRNAWPGEFLLLPSIKANPALALRQVLTEEGTGCDVFGPGELEAALRTGTEPDSDFPERADEGRRAARARDPGRECGSRSTAGPSSHRTIEVGRRASIGALTSGCGSAPTSPASDKPSEMSPDGSSVRRALDRYKAGIPTEDMLAITEAARSDDPADRRQQASISTSAATRPTRGVERGDRAPARGLLAELRDSWGGWVPRELDLGGGFPAPRDPFGRLLPQRADAPARALRASTPTPRRSARPIWHRRPRAARHRSGDSAPGARAGSGALRRRRHPPRDRRATSSARRRRRALTWVETDSSDAYLADVNLELNRWTCVAGARPPTRAATVTADVTGRTCALDVIVPDAELPESRPATSLAFLDTGAYQDAGADQLQRAAATRHRPGPRRPSRDDPPPRDARGRLRARPGPGALTAAQAGRCSRVTALDHVSITCADLDRSLVFYCDLLGIEMRGARRSRRRASSKITGIADADGPLGRPRARPRAGARADRVRRSPRRRDPPAAERSRLNPHLLARRRHPRHLPAPPRGGRGRGQRAGDDRDARSLAWGRGAFYSSDPDGVTIELIEPVASA